ncbi:hypothetical protein [Bacteriovorax sp. DB6_IX]|uniref:hypothetical protein n=1 Tax=Bacteriovorax sp. DB6_IX TaxID=1353530 RepID=UPI000389FD96|nr:hypothetical protein [Bacteriovorax sp. DB6_IX]EQC51769.1 hypothetical protein M901_1541 [Bacteriovorax sp. DB6_IX]
MNSVLNKVILTAALVLGTNQVFGANFRIKMHDQQFRGENTLHLKQLIKDQHPGAQLGNQRINLVQLTAKSKNGNGRVKLLVDGMVEDADRVDGREYDFHDAHRSTFDYVVLTSINTQRGPWHLDLKGNIKVRTIEVSTTDLRPAPRPRPIEPFFKSFGTKKVDKFIVDTDTFYVSEGGVEAIRLVAVGGGLEIEAVKVYLDNGRVLDMGSLRGYLSEGQELTHHFRTRHGAGINKVVVNATSTSIIGSRSKVELQLGLRR